MTQMFQVITWDLKRQFSSRYDCFCCIGSKDAENRSTKKGVVSGKGPLLIAGISSDNFHFTLIC